ncbi:MAG: flagellar hook-associated protein FlgK [Rhizobiaceae bacterium]
MSLTSALQTAQNSLLNVTRQTSIVSRNVTDAGTEGYSRREGVIDSSNLGSRVVVVRNGVESQLSIANLEALSESKAQSLISDRLDQLSITINGLDGSRSPSEGLVSLHNSMQAYSAEPSNSLLAEAALQDAKDLVNTLNNASGSLQTFKTSMDLELSNEVGKLNQLLADFYTVNNEVTGGTRAGRDVSDALDQRDRLLADINEIVPVNVLTREGNDVALMTKGGATLFEKVPRDVTFDPINIYSPATTGNPIRIDGVPVLGGTGANTTASGSLSAMIQLRDDSGATIQSQLDEVARGLITAFAETDATGGGAPALTGLFTYSGGPGIPAAGVLQSGLASDIAINAAFDPAQGGSASLMRDGGANGAAYTHNPAGAASYSDHLISLVQSLDGTTAFDGQSEIGGSMSLLTYAAQSLGWLDGQRSEASQSAATKEALHIRLSEKISNQTGVNIDEEMALLLQLEHSYEASARVITAVDEMLATLLSVVR